MDTKKNESLLFANENAIFRIISIAKILSWVILVIYLILFVDNIKPLFQGQMQWPKLVTDWITLLAKVLNSPAIGLMFFLLLQGVAQGLNLGLDVFYDLQPDEDEEEVAGES